MPPSPPSISRTLPSSPAETLFPLNNSLLTPFPGAPGKHCATFCLYEPDCSQHLIEVGITQHLSFCVWLISLRIMASRLIHVVACDRFPSFLRWNNISLCRCSAICLRIHLLTDRWIVPPLATVNDAAAVSTAYLTGFFVEQFILLLSRISRALLGTIHPGEQL